MTATLTVPGRSHPELRFWIGAFAVALALHAGAVVALMWQRATPPAGPAVIVADIAPLLETTMPAEPAPPPRLAETVNPAERPPQEPAPSVQQVVPEPAPVIESRAETAPPLPKPRPAPRSRPPEPAVVPPQAEPAPQPQPQPQQPDYTSWSALDHLRPQTATSRTSGQFHEYHLRVQHQIERHKIYPRLARARGIEGAVRLRFVIDRSGQLVSYWIEKGSGHDVLDAAVHSIIQNAAPFPPAPADLSDDQLDIAVVVRFNLR